MAGTWKATADELLLPMIDRLMPTKDEFRRWRRHLPGAALEPGRKVIAGTRPNGLHISKVRVPIGVIGIIYESRPNVTTDAAVLCTKTGNAVILRGGSESIRSNIAIAEALGAGAVSAGLPEDSILLISKTGRDSVRQMAEMDQYMISGVPRGGRAIETVVNYARMPVIKHYLRVCIAYVDKEPIDSGAKVVNASDASGATPSTVLVHRGLAAPFSKIAPILAERK
jgi:glutamate-5-semialdehyde dehydrogenase